MINQFYIFNLILTIIIIMSKPKLDLSPNIKENIPEDKLFLARIKNKSKQFINKTAATSTGHDKSSNNIV